MTTPLLIGNDWRSKGRENFSSIYPEDGSVSAEIAIATKSDFDDAMKTARAAVEAPDWRKPPANRRTAMLAKLAKLIERDTELLAAMHPNTAESL